MKRMKFLFLILTLLSFSTIQAMSWEFYFYIKNNAGEAQDRSIVIYRYDGDSKSYVQLASGTSYTNWTTYGGPNAVCNIIEVTPSGENPNITPDIHWYETYIVRIENKFVTLTYGGGTDAGFEYNTDLDSILVIDATWSVTYHGDHWNDKSILLKNNFAGGDMWINSYRETNIPINGFTRAREATTFPHTITAINNQQPGSYKMLWDKWSDTYAYLGYDLSSAQDFDKTANFKKEYNITFRNYYGSSGSTGGAIKVRGNQVNSPSVDNLVTEGEAISGEALNQTINYVYFTIDHWSDGLGTSASINPTPTDHKTYTAYLKGTPSNTGKNFTFHGNVGDPINFTWTDNPNTDVTQYQIWRRVKHNGILGDATLLATVDRGVETYTDEYSFTDGYTDDILSYDVRAHYEPDDSYSDPQWNIAYGELLAKINENSIAVGTIANEVPTDYSITNYPNPFNPTTTINYQLPADGFVTLKIYDMLGKEIITLVNERKSAGYYRINFDASKLTSGVYVYTITVNKFIQSKKMLLMK